MRLFALVAVFLGLAVAHSWLACADYRITDPSDEQVYVPAKCKGFIRNFGGGYFGEDRGDNYPTNNPNCGKPFPNPISSGYTVNLPMSQYSPGQNVCMAWPAKNHVAATCRNDGNNPDFGLTIFISKANPTANPSASDLTVVKAFPRNPGANKFIGFQYCPQFCAEPDKATCTGCFTVPSNLQMGATYTFMWSWAYNSATDIYANCWEASMGPPSTETTAQPTITATTATTTTTQTTAQTTTTTTTQRTTATTQTTQTTQTTATQQTTTPQTSQANCVSQCIALCGSRGVKSCDCSGGFNAICGADAVSHASTIALSILGLTSVFLF